MSFMGIRVLRNQGLGRYYLAACFVVLAEQHGRAALP